MHNDLLQKNAEKISIRFPVANLQRLPRHTYRHRYIRLMILMNLPIYLKSAYNYRKTPNFQDFVLINPLKWCVRGSKLKGTARDSTKSRMSSAERLVAPAQVLNLFNITL